MRIEAFHRTPSQTFDVEHAASVSEAVVDAVAAFDGSSPLELPPLYDAIDPDALDAVFDAHLHTGPRPSGTIDFPYHGYLIRVRETGEGCIFERE